MDVQVGTILLLIPRFNREAALAGYVRSCAPQADIWRLASGSLYIVCCLRLQAESLVRFQTLSGWDSTLSSSFTR